MLSSFSPSVVGGNCRTKTYRVSQTAIEQSLSVAVCFYVCSFSCLLLTPASADSDRQSFDQAQADYTKHDFHAAAKKFWEVSTFDDDLAPEALLYLARCRRSLGQAPQYVDTVSQLDRRFPDSSFTATSLWDLREWLSSNPHADTEAKGGAVLDYRTNPDWISATLLRRFPTSEYAVKIVSQSPHLDSKYLLPEYLNAILATHRATADLGAITVAREVLLTANRVMLSYPDSKPDNERHNPEWLWKLQIEKDRKHLPDLWLKLYEDALPKLDPWTARGLLRQELRENPFPQVVQYCRTQSDTIASELLAELKQQGEKAIQDKRYPDAQATYRKLLAEFPDEMEAATFARTRLSEVGATILKSDKTTADLIAQADRKLRFRKQTEAETLYRQVYDAHRDLEGAESLLLKVAESQKERKDYDASLKSLEEILTAHPDSPAADDALFDKAVLLGCQLKRRDEGIALLRRLLNHNTSSARAADAEYMLGYLCLTVDDKEGARLAFNELITNYPASPRVAWAKKDMEALSR